MPGKRFGDRRRSLAAPVALLPESTPLPSWLRPLVLRASGMGAIELVAGNLDFDSDAGSFARAALAQLGVGYALAEDELAQVPAAGGVIIVANHPFGGIDGLIGIAALHARRPDLRLLANGVLARLKPLAPNIIPVSPFGDAAQGNARSVRAALRHVAAGGALLLFPAGEVSHLQLRRAAVTDPTWAGPAARLVQIAGVPVVPMHFSGRNSLMFQLAGLVHPRLRTLLLPRELVNKCGQRVQVRVGPAISATRIARLQDAATIAGHLRASVYLLASAPVAQVADAATGPGNLTEELLVAPVPPEQLAAEIAALPAGQRLASASGLQVLCARAGQIPRTLQEIGRLREVTFRAVGEGTGGAADLDIHDDYYEHLFLWHAESRQVVGAYRIGRIDEIRSLLGNRGLYLHSLFEFREPFFALLGPALELGRSWVRVEYQRSFAPLLLLWRGISEYIGRNPRYARLIGPASVSNRYDPLSRSLLVEALRSSRGEPLLGSLVRARRPFKPGQSLRSLFASNEMLTDVEALGLLIEDREPDGKGVPVLLRQYLKLGARTIAFNVDPAFGDSLDCLIVLDLRRVGAATLARYMSATSLQRFQSYWKLQEPEQRRAG
jgi:putative hemolysin